MFKSLKYEYLNQSHNKITCWKTKSWGFYFWKKKLGFFYFETSIVFHAIPGKFWNFLWNANIRKLKSRCIEWWNKYWKSSSELWERDVSKNQYGFFPCHGTAREKIVLGIKKSSREFFSKMKKKNLSEKNLFFEIAKS